MFSADDILARTRRQPFQPFRIVTTTGKSYEIHHPDQAMTTRRCVNVPPPAPTPDGVPDRYVDVAILHIVEIQDMAPAPPATSNGQA